MPIIFSAPMYNLDQSLHSEVYDRTRLAKILGRLETLIDVLGEEKMTRQIEQ
ncbi:MAG: hypothetical protein F6K31_38985 [Symploca sp. SIO2G7]|nr:hypothetical protein [Symploca sp. SIO2G7]